MPITIKAKGDFKKSYKFLKSCSSLNMKKLLTKYAKIGVDALSEATPKRTGKTAASWTYEIKVEKDSAVLSWINTNIQDGINVAVVLQYGHATSTGYWIEGRDYINPAMQPVFDTIANDLWKEVTAI